MIAKTLSGISIIDEAFGGVFSNRSFLVCGPSQSGKTVLGLRFTQQGLQQNERCLYLSTIAANDLSICAGSLGIELGLSIESGDLTLLEYESFIHGNGTPGLDMLPPEGFDQLRDIIHATSIERVVLDTVLPWVSVKQPDRMAEQIFSFTRSFDRLGVTTMLTLPKPVSNMSFRLKKSIEDVVPISILLNPEAAEAPASIQVVKYLGEKKLGGKTAYNIGTGEKIDEQELAKPEASAEKKSVSGPSAIKTPDEPEKLVGLQTRRPRFSAIPRDPQRPADSGYIPPTRAVQPSPEKQYEEYPAEASRSPQRSPLQTNASPNNSPVRGAPKAARLSSIWKPHPASEQDSGSQDA